MPDFSKVKVGDRVYCLKYGWGTVDDILDPSSNVRPILVRFDDYRDSITSYSVHGFRTNHGKTPSLYWDIPTISDPPKPKRKVKKQQEVWVNVYRGGNLGDAVHKSKESAMEGRYPDTHIGVAHGILEWEEEE